MWSGVPSATTVPPRSPAPGPMSMTQSAERMVSSSCSTTMTCVAQVAQSFQGADQAGVVALMQANAGFVEDVHHADQARTDLGGQADALCLAA